MSRPAADSREASPYHHGDLRQALLDAALAGLESGETGLREIARAIGVSAAAPYRHFKNREALLAAVASQGFVQLAEAMIKATQGIPEKYHLGVMGIAYVEFARHHKALFQLMFSPELDKPSHPELERTSEATYALLAQTAGREAPDKPAEATLGSWALVHGLAQLINDGQFPPMAESESRALIASILKRSIDGMRALRRP